MSDKEIKLSDEDLNKNVMNYLDFINIKFPNIYTLKEYAKKNGKSKTAIIDAINKLPLNSALIVISYRDMEDLETLQKNIKDKNGYFSILCYAGIEENKLVFYVSSISPLAINGMNMMIYNINGQKRTNTVPTFYIRKILYDDLDLNKTFICIQNI